MELITDILYHIFGISLCSIGRCYGGYIENGNLICRECGKVICFKTKRKSDGV